MDFRRAAGRMEGRDAAAGGGQREKGGEGEGVRRERLLVKPEGGIGGTECGSEGVCCARGQGC